MGFRILDIAYALGEKPISIRERFPDDISRLISKTGIETVYETEGTALDMAIKASREVLERHPDIRIGAVIYVTQSPVYFLPANACILHDALGLPRAAMAFDINQGCSGFVQGLCVATALLPSAGAVLLVCADRYRSKLRHDDRSTQAVFSDGASATLITSEPRIRIAAQTHDTYGAGRPMLYQGIGSAENDGFLHMSGADVFLFTRRQVGPQLAQTLASAGLALGDLDSVFVHQASALVVDNMAKEFAAAKAVPSNVGEVGNTVSSSIPILLTRHLDIVNTGRNALCGFGVGLSSSCVVLAPVQ